MDLGVNIFIKKKQSERRRINLTPKSSQKIISGLHVRIKLMNLRVLVWML